jgi:hypothetical protein
MASEPKPKLIRAAVTRGHTVMIGQQANGPGTLVELPEEEARHLMAHGFLAEPNAPQAPVGMGPIYSEDAPMITEVSRGR